MQEQIETYLKQLEINIITGEWMPIQCTKDWCMSFDKEAGVYAIKEDDKICYIGESGSLRKRMKDLLDTRNHSFRQKVGHTLFADKEGYEKGSSKKKFPANIEVELNLYFEHRLTISTIVVAIGRKELEERLVAKYNPIYNTRGKRES